MGILTPINFIKKTILNNNYLLHKRKSYIDSQLEYFINFNEKNVECPSNSILSI